LGGTLHTQTRAARQSIADIASSANITSLPLPPSPRITHQPHHAPRNQQRQRLRLHASNMYQCGVLNASRPCCSRDCVSLAPTIHARPRCVTQGLACRSMHSFAPQHPPAQPHSSALARSAAYATRHRDRRPLQSVPCLMRCAPLRKFWAARQPGSQAASLARRGSWRLPHVPPALKALNHVWFHLPRRADHTSCSRGWHEPPAVSRYALSCSLAHHALAFGAPALQSGAAVS